MEYELEYGSAVIEMHADSIKTGQKVVIVDDLIATGGTTEAMIRLIENLGGEVVKICLSWSWPAYTAETVWKNIRLIP